MSETSILVVEDEEELGNNIYEYLNSLNYKVYGPKINSEEVLDFINEMVPTIILMDIQLAGKVTGVELAQIIKDQHPQVAIIFITAFSSENILDQISDTLYSGYLLKPFSLKTLDPLIYLTLKKQALTTFNNSEFNKNSKINVRDKGRLIPLDEDEVIYIQSDGLYTKIITTTKTYMMREILKNFIENIDQEKFIRIHKSFVINISKVKSINSKFLDVGGFEIPIRRGFSKTIIEKIGKI